MTEQKKIHIHISDKLHKLLRIKCAELETTIQEFVEKLLEKELTLKRLN